MTKGAPRVSTLPYRREVAHRQRHTRLARLTLRVQRQITAVLGLYICKEIANKLNGDLYAASTLGEGTIMTITLPELARNA
jgi:signal transduction histidine kinase